VDWAMSFGRYGYFTRVRHFFSQVID
jgi:hypothetical protein